MPGNYLTKRYHASFWLVLCILFLTGAWLLLLFMGALYSLVLFFFRSKRSSHSEDLALRRGVAYAPVNGQIHSIRTGVDHCLFGSNKTEIRITMPWNKEYGIYLPESCEVRELRIDRTPAQFLPDQGPLPEQSERTLTGVCLALKSISGGELGLQFLKFTASRWPSMRVMAGDRGKGRANVGFFPFGGTVLLYLPSNYEILVQKDAPLVAGETLIAGTASN